MLIHLKKNERLFINGAVIRMDRRGSIELLNDAHFLLENHVMQPENATTPLRRLYFVAQTMLMDPTNASLTKYLFDTYVEQIRQTIRSEYYLKFVNELHESVSDGDYYDSLKQLRKNFKLDEPNISLADEQANINEKAA